MSKSLFIYALLFLVTSLEAQVHIGPTAQSPDPSAVLELESGFNKGLLLPRMRKIDMLAIPSPAEGLTVYLTEEHVSYVFNGTEWVKVHGGNDAFELPYDDSFNLYDAVLKITNTQNFGAAIEGNTTAEYGTGVRGYTTAENGTGVRGYASNVNGIAGSFVNSEEGISLLSIGKTGIGTYNPSNLLHVNGANTEGPTMIVEDNINPVIQLKHYGNNQGYLAVDEYDMVMATNVNNNVGNVVLRTENTDRLIVDNIGNVGIGAPTTNARLYVDGINTNSNTLVLNDQNPVIQFKNNGENIGVIQTTGNDLKIGTNFENSSASIIMRTKGIDRMELDSNGHIGIGIEPSGTHRFAVEGSMAIDNDFNINTGPSLWFQKTYPNNSVLSMAVLYASTDYIRFTSTARGYEFEDNNGNKWLRLNKTTGYANFQNRIGVNTVSPSANLHLNGVNDGATAMIINDNDPVIQMQNEGSNKGYIQVDGNDMVLAANISNASGKVIIRTNDTDRVFVDNAGNVSIGGSPPPPGYKLSVKGQIAATDFDVVAASDWPDYVFDPAYKLMSLEEVEEFIIANNHLPNIPKAAVLEQYGYSLPEMQKLMMEKIEELTLHLIEANKQIKELQEKIKP